MNKLQSLLAKVLFVLFFSVLSINTYAQGEWINQVYKPDVRNIEYNPMKGLIPGYSGINSNFPYSTDHFYIDLKSIYINYDRYDWTTFDSKLNNITSRGCHAIARFWIDYPNQTYGMPTFLQSVVPAVDYTNMGNTVGKSKLPDWNNETLMTALEKFIAAFGARYDGDPRIIMIEAGLYGFWGEWHNSGTTGKDMTQANKDRILNAYLNAFKKTHIALRQANHPSTVELARKLGYYDDSFCWQTICTKGNWCFMYSILNRNITDIYKTKPIGGEIFPDLQKTLFDTWPNTAGEDIAQSVNQSHMSFNKCFFLFKQQPNANQFANGLKMHNMMGYRFFVHSVKMNLNEQKQLNINVNLQNLGVAPIYYNWQVEFSAINSVGSWIKNIGTADWNTNSIYPSATEKYFKTFSCILPTNGRYTILMRFKNPLDNYTANAKVLRFANEKQDSNKDGWLTLGTVDVNTEVNDIEATTENQIRVYYNASHNQLNIESQDGNMSDISIYTLVGKLIYTSKQNGSIVKINSNYLKNNDMIVLKIISNNKTTMHKVVVK